MLTKFEYLIALAREKNFGRAAQACGVTQPSFSAGIRALEEQVGLPLVIRSSRFQGFTPEGEIVLGWARRIATDLRSMRLELATASGGLAGLLRISVIPTALAVVAGLTSPFRARHPNVRFSVESANSGEILRQLQNAEIDVGVTYLDNEPIGKFRFTPLYREHYRLVTSALSAFGERDAVSWAEVAQTPLCLLTPDMQNRRIIDRLLSRSGAHLPPAVESNSIMVLLSHVRTGNWSCVLPEKLVEIFGLGPGFRSIPINDPEEAHIVGLLASDRSPMPPLAQAMFTLVLEGGLVL
ncbi:LysR family transcriptional regulator [Acidocella facilis]|uniref:LysR family transcriptional regulator n=1 Tax=Acidocella facilis TaxID=525 RepID=UPI00047EA71E|nr:LysR family transcriptional regulator [Acidocella facilis]